MRKLRKDFLFVLCLCVMLGLTACGSGDDMNGTTDQKHMNNATESTYGNGNDSGRGVVDDLGDAVGEGINDIGDGVEDFTDDMTGNR